MESKDNNKSIKDILANISKDISFLEKEKNLGKIVKNYNKINDDIKKTFSIIHELQNKIRTFENLDSDQNITVEIVDDSQYEDYEKELSNNKIDNIINSENLSEQIDCFKDLVTKLNSCKKYLESKKTIIIECEKDNTEEKNKEKNKNIVKKKQIQKKKNESSSDSDTISDSDSCSSKSDSNDKNCSNNKLKNKKN